MSKPPPRKRQYRSGSISRAGRRWRIRWRVAGQQRSETHPTRDLAERALAGLLGDLARAAAGLAPDPDRVPTLAVLAKEWFEEREGPANRNNAGDRRDWENHLKTPLGHLRPDEVSAGRLRIIIVDRLKAKLSAATVLKLMRILSSFYTWLIEEGRAAHNPVRALPKTTRAKMRPTYDWRNTPFVRRQRDVRRLFMAMPPPVNVAYAIGVMRGLRPGEIRALRWHQVDLEQRLIHVTTGVYKGKEGPPKSRRGRTVSISAELHPVLAAWRLRSKGDGLVIPPPARKRKGPWIEERALHRALAAALAKLELPSLTWYQATRHTFGSHFVLEGGSLEKLGLILGHSSSEVTKRYAHLRPEQLRPEDTERAQVDLGPGAVKALRPLR